MTKHFMCSADGACTGEKNARLAQIVQDNEEGAVALGRHGVDVLMKCEQLQRPLLRGAGCVLKNCANGWRAGKCSTVPRAGWPGPFDAPA